jgi:hypothetical protein
MIFTTKEKIESARHKEDNYGLKRWSYIKLVIDMVKQHGFKKVLELGPFVIPIVLDGDFMDRHAYIQNKNLTIHNAKNTPWPYLDKSYDTVISLQVFEHLCGKQKEAFDEIRRISSSAIISLPYKWVGNCLEDHNGIDEEIIYGWTGQVPDKIIIENKRIIQFYKF